MLRRLFTTIAVLTLGTFVLAASPIHHKVRLDQTYAVNNQVLHPGVYELIINGQKATLDQHHKTVLSDLKVENNGVKFHQDGMVSRQADPHPQLLAMEVAGTHYKVKFQ